MEEQSARYETAQGGGSGLPVEPGSAHQRRCRRAGCGFGTNSLTNRWGDAGSGPVRSQLPPQLWPDSRKIQVRREQFNYRDAQHFGEKQKLAVGHTAELRFQLRQRRAANVPCLELEFLGENLLCPALLVAQSAHLLADDVQGSIH